MNQTTNTQRQGIYFLSFLACMQNITKKNPIKTLKQQLTVAN